MEEVKVLICNNCKLFYIAPTEKCKCGCGVLTETHPSNLIFTQEFKEGCDKFFGRNYLEPI
jgi:hypothetical protein